MSQAPKTAISPTRQEDYAEWYQQVVRAADLAETSPVRGCMVIKPWGYALWENMQRDLDARFKATGHKNAYFPLFIPKSFLEKEAAHVEGFAKECAVVTHHRLEVGPDGKLVPAGPLEEPLIVRPTSETIIGEMFAQWIQSYRDLPLLINQWANVVRWEMRTRLFLRTAEFLWQEGHTAHATAEEAMEETRRMLDVYADFCRTRMALPVIPGAKSESERFPGAVETFTIEAMMQDRKALQAGTSHFLGQNFARAAGIRFHTQKETEEFAWTTSWGVSTRLVGALVMAHGDDDGLILPPRLAPSHVALLPVFRDDAGRTKVLGYLEALAAELRAVRYHDRPLEVELDLRDMRGGEKQWAWIKKGIPLRVEVGPRDLEADQVVVGRRDRPVKAKAAMARAEFVARVPALLDEMQAELLERATRFLDEHVRDVDDRGALDAYFTPQNAARPEIHGGFARAPWCGKASCEAAIKERLKVTLRCIPLDAPAEAGRCVEDGAPSERRVLFARAY